MILLDTNVISEPWKPAPDAAVVKLTWSAFALSDRDAIFTYIEADHPAAAALIDERIVAATRRLLDFPGSGRGGRIAGTRGRHRRYAPRRCLYHH